MVMVMKLTVEGAAKRRGARIEGICDKIKTERSGEGCKFGGCSDRQLMEI